MKKILDNACRSLWEKNGTQDSFKKRRRPVEEKRVREFTRPLPLAFIEVTIKHGGERRGYAEAVLQRVLEDFSKLKD